MRIIEHTVLTADCMKIVELSSLDFLTQIKDQELEPLCSKRMTKMLKFTKECSIKTSEMDMVSLNG